MKQYESYSSHIGVKIAKAIVKSKIESQSALLEKHGITCDKQSDRALDKLKRIEADKVELIRTKLHSIEGHFGKFYFNRIMKLFPEFMREQLRQKYKAVGILNNLFNLGYEVLKWEVYKSVLNAHLDPYLGFIHSIQHSKPSLVCDLQEPYRPLIDDFLILYCQKLKVKDFIVKTEDLSRNKKGKRVYLNDALTRDLMKQLNEFFESYVEISRINVGKKQTVETLINEEAMLFAKFLRDERKTWMPRTSNRKQ